MDKFALHNIECYETDNRLKTYKTIYTEIQFFQEIKTRADLRSCICKCPVRRNEFK